jgi:ABC-2 type transport system ATP-binding protein
MNSPAYAVEASELTIRFGDFVAVDHVSFSVRQGEIFGFLGANGAGKTTTIRMLCGLLVPNSGDVRIAGLSYAQGSQAIKRKVGYMSQRFTMYNDLKIDENVAFAAALRKLDEDYVRRRTKELFDFIDFRQSLDTLVRDLPGGLKQEISLVVAMLHDPEILFLDEPTAGVAPSARARFWDLIRKIAASRKTVFVTTHYMDEAENCERIALMRTGKIIALDSPEGLKKSAYPEPLMELMPRPESGSEWIKHLQAESCVESLRPHGMRWHASIRDPKAWEQIKPRYEAVFEAHPVQPSLEDVFVRLVEGESQ